MKARGFTLIELMTAVAVLAILVSVAVPSFKGFTATQRLRAASFDLRTDLLLARSEALKRNMNVTIKRSHAEGWQSGWIVLVDSNEATLRSHAELASDVDIDFDTSAITFGGNGRITAPAGSIQIGLASSTGSLDLNRCIVLDPSGMPRTYAEACS